MKDLLRIQTRDDAWGGATGKGIRVAVVDSGVDASHPAVAGCVKGGVDIEDSEKGPVYKPCTFTDAFGHGTACAGIIHELAPEAELYSVKVLGKQLTGSGATFLAGMKWAVDNQMDLVNLSLGTTKDEYFVPLHELADYGYYNGGIFIAAANNVPPPSYPSIYSSLISVGNAALRDKFSFIYCPGERIDFKARGTDVRAPWLEHGYRNLTGTSFAAPHMSGISALIMSKHGKFEPFELRTVLRHLADDSPC